MQRRKRNILSQNSLADLAKEEILMMSYQLACVLMKSTHYNSEKVLKVFDYFSNVEEKKQRKSGSISEKKLSFLQNIRNSD
jgi:ABC-type branched-subunit amino acid transport system ATPase component